VDQDRIDKALRQAAGRISRKRKIPGFRKGKAPYEVILNYMGKGSLYEEALGQLGPRIYEEALEEQNIEPYGQADLEIEELEPLVLKFLVPLRPSVEMGDYGEIRLEYEVPSTTDDDVNEVVDTLRKSRATWSAVDRAAKMDDRVTLGIEGTIEGETVINDDNMEIVLSSESPPIMPGFSEKTEGMEKDGEGSWSLTYPEDFPNQNLAGKQMDFQVKLVNVEERELPELTDEMASELGEYQTAEELIADIRKDLEDRAQIQADRNFESLILDRLVEEAQIDYPPSALKSETDRLFATYIARIEGQGLSLEQYLQITGSSEDQLRQDLSVQARKQLERDLTLDEVAEAEGIAVEAGDVDAEIESMLEGYGSDTDRMRRVFSSEAFRASISSDLTRRRALDKLVNIAKGEVEEEPATDEDEAPQDVEAEAPPSDESDSSK
jgi:trigger factor